MFVIAPHLMSSAASYKLRRNEDFKLLRAHRSMLSKREHLEEQAAAEVEVVNDGEEYGRTRGSYRTYPSRRERRMLKRAHFIGRKFDFSQHSSISSCCNSRCRKHHELRVFIWTTAGSTRSIVPVVDNSFTVFASTDGSLLKRILL